MEISTIDDTKRELEAWGRWQSSGGVHLDCGSGMPLPLGSTISSVMISDDRALEIDRAVARLIRRAEDMGNIIFLYYTKLGWTDDRVAKHLKMSKGKVSALRRSGEAWIDGVLYAQTFCR